jgi:uncharacterized membrane protein (UPF0127 family)
MKSAVLTKGDGTVLSDRCHLAYGPLTRMRGLLGRSGLDPGESMLFRPTGSIHMMFMRFAIDAVFCDRDLVVIKVVPGAKIVIELAEGAAADVRAGDQLAIATIDP